MTSRAAPDIERRAGAQRPMEISWRAAVKWFAAAFVLFFFLLTIDATMSVVGEVKPHPLRSDMVSLTFIAAVAGGCGWVLMTLRLWLADWRLDDRYARGSADGFERYLTDAAEAYEVGRRAGLAEREEKRPPT